MTQVKVTKVRIGAIAMLAAIFVCGICRESAAEATERNSSQSRDAAARKQAAATSEQATLPPMRYYGGPKSPMWRGN